MHALVLFLALALSFAGCVCVYLASPNQVWRGSPLPPRLALALWGILSLGGIAGLAWSLFPTAAVVVYAVWAMACLVALPHLGALTIALRQGG